MNKKWIRILVGIWLLIAGTLNSFAGITQQNPTQIALGVCFIWIGGMYFLKKRK